MPALNGPASFVGRERELTALAARLEEANAGRGGIVLIAGEPGIGKTRVLQELARLASDQHAAVLWGRCDDIEGAPAYWPWLQGLRSAVQSMDVGALQADLGAGAGEIAQILPAIADRLSSLPAPAPEADPARARFRLFDALATFLLNAGRRQPLLVLLDDLQWADSASLLFLQFLVRRLDGARLLVVGSHREKEVGPEHPLSRTMEALTREHAGEQLALRGLSKPQADRFIALLTGAELPKEVVAAIHRESGGNPFFITEIVHLLRAGDRSGRTVTDSGWRVDVPETVREVIARRLTHGSRTCSEVLAIASVIGQTFRLAVLTRIADLGDATLLEALDEAVTARLIAEAPGAVGQYEFAHTLIRETLYSAMGPARRLHLHRQVGEALEQLYRATPEPHLAELAHHFVQAAPAGTAAKAGDYARRAGEQALVMLAYETAVRHFRVALEVLDLETAPDQSLRGELFLGLGDSLWMAGDVSGAKAAYEEAMALARRLGAGSDARAGRLLARATLGYGHVLHAHEWWGFAEPYLRLYEEALAALREESIGLRSRLLAGVAASHAYLGQIAEASRAADEAVALAERIGDRAALLDALEARVRARFGPGDVAARLADAAAIVRLAETAGDRERELRGREHLLWSLLEQGDVVAADAEIETYARRAEASRLPISRWTALKLRSIRAQMDGRFAEAQRYADEALALAREAQIPLADLEHLWQSLFIQKASGEIRTWRDLPEQIVSIAVDQPGGIGRITLAGFYAEIDRRDQARQWFEAVAAGDFAGVPRDVTRPFLLSLLAEVCAYLGDGPRAAVLYPLLLPYAETNVLMAVALTCVGAAGRHLGLLAATMGDWQTAERHFEDALAMNGRMGARSWLVRTQQEYAQTLLARGGTGDHPRAQHLLSAAGDTARTLGMAGPAEQIGWALRDDHIESDAELAPADGAMVAGAPAPASGRGHLTPREVEVLRLLAAGLSNRRIAERLVVSRRTVEHHLTAIYAKIGAQGRVEAAAYALKHGIT